MGSECKTPSKYRYDITMSKRTRKSLKLEDSEHNNPLKGTVDFVGGEESTSTTKVDDGKENDNKSLKQLINDKKKSKMYTSIKESKGRNSIGKHFTHTEEQKLLQLVKTQQQNSAVERVKLKGMVNHYVKLLRHLIKVKCGPCKGSRKKPILQLSM